MLSGYEIIRYGLPACSRETRCLISSVTAGARDKGQGTRGGAAGGSLCLSCEFYAGLPGEIGMPPLDTAPRRCDSGSTPRACARAHARTVDHEVNREQGRAVRA